MLDYRTRQLDERSRLVNGRFVHNLNNWTATSASYSPGDGDDHYGIASISVGGTLEQTFSVPYARLYTLHLSCKSPSGALSGSQATATIKDADGATVKINSLTGGTSAWTDNDFTLGLAPGATYTLSIANASAAGAIRIDDVWLWHVPLTRANIAARVERKLAQLATDASLSTTASGTQTEGSYTDAIDAGLRAVGAVDPETDQPDVRWLDSGSIDSLADQVEREMLERLLRYYAIVVDIEVGERSEKLSQIGKAIQSAISAQQSGGAKVVVRRLIRRTDDFDLGA